MTIQVKEDNEEISMMERQIVEAQEKARSLTEARDQLDQDLEENQSERNQKYREERMDQFLQSFDDTKEEEQQKLTELEGLFQACLKGFLGTLFPLDIFPQARWPSRTISPSVSFINNKKVESNYDQELNSF